MSTSAPAATNMNLCFLLSQASHALTTELTAALTAVGLSPRTHCVLSNAITDELTQGELAERCALDKTTMVVTIDELERSGLAQRRTSSTDRRARIISVTEAGARVVAEGQTIVDRVHQDVLGALPEAQRTAFIAALARLVGGRLSHVVPCEQPVRRRVPRSPKVGS